MSSRGCTPHDKLMNYRFQQAEKAASALLCRALSRMWMLYCWTYTLR